MAAIRPGPGQARERISYMLRQLENEMADAARYEGADFRGIDYRFRVPGLFGPQVEVRISSRAEDERYHSFAETPPTIKPKITESVSPSKNILLLTGE